LFYRLSILEIALVPLRERREDIPYLTAMFVHEFAERLNRPITGVTPAAERLLQHASWPGNIRELRNVIERACILTESRILSERELMKAMSTPPSAPGPTAAPAPSVTEPSPSLFSTAQREQIERVLQQVGGNKAAAARLLGMSRRSLYRWLDRLDVQR
jgi:DNA-binding NtrC family response regulator